MKRGLDKLTKERSKSSSPSPLWGEGRGEVSKDRLSAEHRSWNMSRIRGKDTKPELIVRSLLHRMGYRFRLHVRIPVGQVRNEKSEVRTRKNQIALRPSHLSLRYVRPDIVLPKYKTALFVHGWWSPQDLQMASPKVMGARAHCKPAPAQRL